MQFSLGRTVRFYVSIVLNLRSFHPFFTLPVQSPGSCGLQMVAVIASFLNIRTFCHSPFHRPVRHRNIFACVLATLSRHLMHTLIPCLCTSFIGPSGSQDIIPEDGVGREIILYPLSAYGLQDPLDCITFCRSES